MYDLEKEKIIKEVKKRSAKRVIIQIPDILKAKSKEIANLIENKTNSEVVIIGDSCYGACDLADRKANWLKGDLLIHFGHSSFGLKELIPTIYIPLKDTIDLLDPLKNSKILDDYKKIGLAATIQHIHKIKEVKQLLEEKGKEVFIGKTDSKKIAYPGQILGCDISTCKNIKGKVDCFLCISGGNFHGLGLAYSIKKPVYILDPYKKEIRDIEPQKRKFLKKKYARIDAASNVNNFGIIIGLKRGQLNTNKAFKIKKEIENLNKKAYIIAIDEISPKRLINFPKIDAFIITACPRIPYDLKGWKKPVINVKDFYEMLKSI